ncbi:MAG: phosphatase PAP2 family protein [Halobacteriaceae archaeon]
MRGVGALGGAQALVPDALTPLVVALTHLGDPLVVLVALVGVYWLGPRSGLLTSRDAAALLAAGFATLALALLLKGGFGLPRPPTTLHRIPEDGAGFPSGHATAAATLYGGVAMVLDRWSRRTRAVGAAGLIGLVALTRLVLGVHYLVDVVVGAAVGLAAVAAVLWIARPDPARGFALATVVGLGAVAAAGVTTETTMAAAGAAGATAAWRALDGLDAAAPSLGAIAVGGVGFVGAAVGTLALTPPLPMTVAINIGLGAGVVGLPALRTSRGTSPSPTR